MTSTTMTMTMTEMRQIAAAFIDRQVSCMETARKGEEGRFGSAAGRGGECRPKNTRPVLIVSCFVIVLCFVINFVINSYYHVLVAYMSQNKQVMRVFRTNHRDHVDFPIGDAASARAPRKRERNKPPGRRPTPPRFARGCTNMLRKHTKIVGPFRALASAPHA